MKALDTNILARLATADDAGQTKKALELFANAERRGQKLFVSLPAMMELIWVLRSSFRLPREAIVECFSRLAELEALSDATADLMERFATNARSSDLELEDLLIGLSAQEAGCTATLTFDKRASRSELFELL